MLGMTSVLNEFGQTEGGSLDFSIHSGNPTKMNTWLRYKLIIVQSACDGPRIMLCFLYFLPCGIAIRFLPDIVEPVFYHDIQCQSNCFKEFFFNTEKTYLYFPKQFHITFCRKASGNNLIVY